MTNVPQIVRDRLKAAPPVEHPDANLLTAFAESSLSGHERTTVLHHLSRCADCREVVVLALPATEAVQPTSSPKRISWPTWPALRWGLVAAGVVAVASVGVVRYQHENRAQTASLKAVATEARNDVPVPPASSADASKATSHAAYPAPNAPAPRERRQEPAAPAEAKRTLLMNPAIGGAVLGQRVASLPQAQAPTPASPVLVGQQPARSKDFQVPAANEVVEVTGANVQTEIAENRTAPTQALDLNEPAVAKSKNAEAPQAASAGAAAAAPSPNPSAGAQVAEAQMKIMQSPARWTISGTGALQRSFDQGQTWQDVNVAANAMSVDTFYFKQETAEVSAKPAAKQSLKKGAAAPMTFRAVTANGLDVWAGGPQGALYHSADNGNHWTRVVPTSSGLVLSGDIVALDFPDPQHGKVTTSTPEVWITTDAGQTWQKQ